jgi:molecular chaperone DnaK
MFKDFEGKVDAKELDVVKADVEDLKKLLEEKNVEKIKTAMDAFNEKIQKLSTEMYQKAAAEQQAAGADPNAGTNDKNEGEKVVDAEFEDVSEDKKE